MGRGRHLSLRCGRRSGFCGTVEQTHRRRLAFRADSRCACAAVGEPTGGVARALRHTDSQAGYRSAQDLVVIPLFSHGSQGAADGGAVGGSATGRCREVSAHRADR